MSSYFIKYNIFFGLKIGILFLLSTSYFLVTMIFTSNMRKSHKQFDSILEQINKAFFDSFQIFLTFKEQIELFHSTSDKTQLKIPSDSEISRPKIGNVLMNIIRNSKYSAESLSTIEKLYNDNACEVLTQNISEYNYCENILSSILTKGLEQAIVQMSIIITNCIDELNSLKKNKNLTDIFMINTTYSNYEMFMGYYMLEAFLMTQNIFEVFRNDEKLFIYSKLTYIFMIYIIFYSILVICSIYFIRNYKKIENSFLNFIGILPDKFIYDDEDFRKAIFKLGQYFY